MDSQQRRRINTFVRMLAFVTANPLPRPLRGAPPGFNGQVQALRSAIDKARAQVMEQRSGATGRHVAHRRRLRAVLRSQHLQPIREISKTLEGGTAGLPKLVNLPDRFASEEAVIGAARATQRDIAPYEQLLIEKGLAPDFSARLAHAVDALEHAVDDYNDLRGKKIQGRASLQAAIKAGADARRCLTAIIRQCCAADPEIGTEVLAAWLNAAQIWRNEPKDLDPFPPGGPTSPATTTTAAP